MEDIDMDEIDDYFRELRGERRSRMTRRTPGSGRRRKTPKTPSRGRSRSRATAARKLRLPSATKSMSVDRSARFHREAVKLTSAPKSSRSKFDIYHLNKGKSLDEIDRMWKRRNAGKYKLKTRKVRHNNARKVLNKMPAGGKSYAKRRMTSRKPKGAYRGAVMPRWAKGETKHILVHDGMSSGTSNCPVTTTCGELTKAQLNTGLAVVNGEKVLALGKIESWCLNPCPQGNEAKSRNGRSIDGTYLRIQGHIRNRDGTNKAYVRMLVLSVKGGQSSGKAAFNEGTLFKKIDGSVVGYEEGESSGDGSKRVRSLQLPVNKQMFTVLYDQKMQLANTTESFGSSDRLFDAKIALKQKTKFFDEHAASFENNQLVFVAYTVDPTCSDTLITVDNTSGSETGIALEFESKYSYKDF